MLGFNNSSNHNFSINDKKYDSYSRNNSPDSESYYDKEKDNIHLQLAELVKPNGMFRGLINNLLESLEEGFLGRVENLYDTMRRFEKWGSLYHNDHLRAESCFYRAILDQAKDKYGQLANKLDSPGFFTDSSSIQSEKEELEKRIIKTTAAYTKNLQTRIKEKVFFGGEDKLYKEALDSKVIDEKLCALNTVLFSLSSELKSLRKSSSNDLTFRYISEDLSFKKEAFKFYLEEYKEFLKKVVEEDIDYIPNGVEFVLHSGYEAVNKSLDQTLTDLIKGHQGKFNKETNELTKKILEIEINFLEERKKSLLEAQKALNEEHIKKTIKENEKGPLSLLKNSTVPLKFLFGDEFSQEIDMEGLDREEAKSVKALESHKILTKTVGLLRQKIKDRKKSDASPSDIRILNSEIAGLKKIYQNHIEQYKENFSSKQSLFNVAQNAAWKMVSFGCLGNGFTPPAVFEKNYQFALLGYDVFEEVKKWIQNLAIGADEGVVSGIFNAIQDEVGIECKEFMGWAREHPMTAARMVNDLLTVQQQLSGKNTEEMLQCRLKNVQMIYKFLDPKSTKKLSLENEPAEKEEQLKYRMFADVAHVLPKIVTATQAAIGSNNTEQQNYAMAIVNAYLPASAFKTLKNIILEVAKISFVQEAEVLVPDLRLAYALVRFNNSGDALVAITDTIRLERDKFLAEQAGRTAKFVEENLFGSESIKDTIIEWYEMFMEASLLDKSKIVMHTVIFPTILVSLMSRAASFVSSSGRYILFDLSLGIGFIVIAAAFSATHWAVEKLTNDDFIKEWREKKDKKKKKDELEKRIQSALNTKEIEEYINLQSEKMLENIIKHIKEKTELQGDRCPDNNNQSKNELELEFKEILKKAGSDQSEIIRSVLEFLENKKGAVTGDEEFFKDSLKEKLNEDGKVKFAELCRKQESRDEVQGASKNSTQENLAQAFKNSDEVKGIDWEKGLFDIREIFNGFNSPVKV